MDKKTLQAQDATKDGALTDEQRTAKKARGTVWAALYLAASQALGIFLGITTGSWIFSEADTSATENLITYILLMVVYLFLAWRSWAKQSRWVAVLIFVCMGAEVVFKVWTTLAQPTGNLNPGFLLMQLALTYMAWQGVRASWRLVRIRRTPAEVFS